MCSSVQIHSPTFIIYIVCERPGPRRRTSVLSLLHGRRWVYITGRHKRALVNARVRVYISHDDVYNNNTLVPIYIYIYIYDNNNTTDRERNISWWWSLLQHSGYTRQSTHIIYIYVCSVCV